MSLGEKIHRLRKLSGMSQEELASQITVSRQAISKWELGESIPDTDNVVQLCRLFNVSADYLLNDDVESEMDIPVVRENSEKLKKRYQLMMLYVLIGVLLISVTVLGFLTQSVLYAIIGAIFIVCFGLGLLFVKAFRKNQKNR
jgi:transcriptional regulator with XRE-family HTH domain